MIRLRSALRLRPATAAALRLLLCALLPILAAGCLFEGTESGTETGFQGAVAREDGTPARGSEVYAFRTGSRTAPGTAATDSALVRILLDPDTLEDTAAFVKAVADGRGEYRFTDLEPGWWSAIVLHADPGRPGRSVAALPAVKVVEDAMAEAGDLVLDRLGGIAATVTYAGEPMEDVMCHIPGLSFVAYTDTAGRCLLLHVPEGTYNLAFTLFGYVKGEATVTVESGSLATVPGGMGLVRSAAGAPPAPRGLRASVDTVARVVTLEWDAVDVPDLAGYRVFRLPSRGAKPELPEALTGALLDGTVYRDTLHKSLPDTVGMIFEYLVRAYDTGPNPEGEAASLKPVRVPAAADPVRLVFADTVFSGTEGGEVVARVRRLGPTDRTVYVAWEQEALTAGPADYAPIPGMLAIPAGAVEVDIRVPLPEDELVEPTEAFRVRLTDPLRGAVLGAPASARLEIRDDDSLSVIRCPKAVLQVNEADSAAEILVLRAGDLGREATVRYATRSGTAEAGKDFTAASGTLAFAPGVQSERLAVRLVRDTVEEKAERFTVVLADPSLDVDASACPEVAVDIADDDTNYVAVPVDFTKASAMQHGWSADVSRFPGGLYEGDTTDKGMGVVSRQASSAALLPKPVGHWDFSDCGQASIRNRAGDMHAGRARGLVCRTDSMGTWARFDGDDSVVVEPHPAFDFRQAITVMAWVKPDSLPYLHTIVAKQYGPTAFALEYALGKYNWHVGIDDGSPEGYSASISYPVAPEEIGRWVHVAATYDGKFQRLYVNGELKLDIPQTGPMVVNPALPIVIGNQPEWNDFYGGIKEVKIFGQPLTFHQIQEQIRLDKVPPRPFALTFDFADPVRVQGAGAVVSGAEEGTTRYHWKLAGAATVADLDGKQGTYVELGTAQNQATDAWSRVGFPARELKVFRFTFEAAQGKTGFIQVNEVSLTGAERVKL